MLHKAWNSKGEMPYRFQRSSVKFQGHTVQSITDFDPNWAFPDYRPVAAFKSLRFALFIILLQFSSSHSQGRWQVDLKWDQLQCDRSNALSWTSCMISKISGYIFILFCKSWVIWWKDILPEIKRNSSWNPWENNSQSHPDKTLFQMIVIKTRIYF